MKLYLLEQKQACLYIFFGISVLKGCAFVLQRLLALNSINNSNVF